MTTCAVCGVMPCSRAQKCCAECPMTPARAELMKIVEEAIAIASSPTGAFAFDRFASLMKLFAPDAWSTERFCAQCGWPARFGYLPPAIQAGEQWFCFDHWPDRPAPLVTAWLGQLSGAPRAIAPIIEDRDGENPPGRESAPSRRE